MNTLRELVAVLGTIEALGIALVLFAGVFLFMAHRSENSKIDFAHTLNDSDNRTSLRKFGEWVALLTSTWIIVYLAKAQLITETYFGLYLAIWVARAAFGALLSAKAGAIAASMGDPNK